MCPPRKGLLILLQQSMGLLPSGGQPVCHTSHDQCELPDLQGLRHSVVLFPCAAAHRGPQEAARALATLQTGS